MTTSPALSLKISGRVLANGSYVAAFLKSIPLLVLGIIAWSMGESRGYADGKSVLTEK
jgi:hypothetical protein